METTRFRVLDSCRGLCAVAVMLFHMDAKTHFYALPLVRNGWVAVDFFFVLSGFVIASAYSRRLRTAMDAGRFALRRFGRLYPLHLAVLLVYVGVELGRLSILHVNDAFSANTSISSLFESLLLLQGFTPDHETWNYPAWSISVELWTNCAFAILAVLFLRRLIACAIVIVVATGAFVTVGDQFALPASTEGAVLLDAARSIFGFFLGFIAFWLFDAMRSKGRMLFPGAELLAIGIVAWVFGAADDFPAIVPSLAFFVAVLIFAFEAGPISRLLRHPAIIKLGTISYSVYLTHSVYLSTMEAVIRALARHFGLAASVIKNGEDLLVFGGPWAMDAAVVLSVGAALFGSTLTYRYIEQPARLFFNSLSDDLARRSAPTKGGAASAAPILPAILPFGPM
jgi:peptidoglycan/LPS O-acetylase OafA/YrhL